MAHPRLKGLLAVAASIAAASAIATPVGPVGGGSGTDYSGNGDAIAWTVTPGLGNGCPVEAEADGFRYSYTLTAASDTLYAFHIPLMSASDVCGIDAPNGWSYRFLENRPNVLEFYTQGFSSDDAIDIQETLGGFAFNSNYDYVKTDFEVFGSDASFMIDPPIPNSGRLPEPGLPLLLSTALMAVAFVARRRKAVTSR
jgi:hypothetical protein